MSSHIIAGCSECRRQNRYSNRYFANRSKRFEDIVRLFWLIFCSKSKIVMLGQLNALLKSIAEVNCIDCGVLWKNN